MTQFAYNNRVIQLDEMSNLEKDLNTRSFFEDRNLRELQQTDEKTTLLQSIKRSPSSMDETTLRRSGASFLDAFLEANEDEQFQLKNIPQRERNLERPCTSRMADDFYYRTNGPGTMTEKRSASSNSLVAEQSSKRPCVVNVKMERLDIDSPRYNQNNFGRNQENESYGQQQFENQQADHYGMDTDEQEQPSALDSNVLNANLRQIFKIANKKAKLRSDLYSWVLDHFEEIQFLINDNHVYERFCEIFEDFREDRGDDSEDEFDEDDDEDLNSSSNFAALTQTLNNYQNTLAEEEHIAIKSEPV
jgi:hypothetical protein